MESDATTQLEAPLVCLCTLVPLPPLLHLSRALQSASCCRRRLASTFTSTVSHKCTDEKHAGSGATTSKRREGGAGMSAARDQQTR